MPLFLIRLFGMLLTAAGCLLMLVDVLIEWSHGPEATLLWHLAMQADFAGAPRWLFRLMWIAPVFVGMVSLVASDRAERRSRRW